MLTAATAESIATTATYPSNSTETKIFLHCSTTSHVPLNPAGIKNRSPARTVLLVPSASRITDTPSRISQYSLSVKFTVHCPQAPSQTPAASCPHGLEKCV